MCTYDLGSRLVGYTIFQVLTSIPVSACGDLLQIM